MYPNLYVHDLRFLLDLLGCSSYYVIGFGRCKGVQDPLDLLQESMCISFFYLSDQLLYLSYTYWFFCGAAVSPAAFCLSRLQLCESKGQKRRGRQWRGMGEMDWSREDGGRKRSGDRLWVKSRISYLLGLGLDYSCIFQVGFGCFLYAYIFKSALWVILGRESWFVFEPKWMFLCAGKH